MWDAYGVQKSYQFWSFDEWLTYSNVSSGSTSSYKRSYYDGRFEGVSIQIGGVGWTDRGTANRGLKAYASTGTVNGYG